MQISLNGQPHDVPLQSTVESLLYLLQIKAPRVAVEVNDVIVKKAVYAHTTLRAGDRIEIVTFVGGG